MSDNRQFLKSIVTGLILSLALGAICFLAWPGSREIIGSNESVRKGLSFIIIGLLYSSWSFFKRAEFISFDWPPWKPDNLTSWGQKFMYHATAISHSLLYLIGIILIFYGLLGHG